jgi:hypothetical protein
LGIFVNPFGDGLAVATGSCASDDDCNFKHKDYSIPFPNRFDAFVHVFASVCWLLRATHILEILSRSPFLTLKP